MIYAARVRQKTTQHSLLEAVNECLLLRNLLTQGGQLLLVLLSVRHHLLLQRLLHLNLRLQFGWGLLLLLRHCRCHGFWKAEAKRTAANVVHHCEGGRKHQWLEQSKVPKAELGGNQLQTLPRILISIRLAKWWNVSDNHCLGWDSAGQTADLSYTWWVCQRV